MKKSTDKTILMYIAEVTLILSVNTKTKKEGNKKIAAYLKEKFPEMDDKSYKFKIISQLYVGKNSADIK